MKTPSAGTPVSVPDLLSGLLGRANRRNFSAALCRELGVPWCGLSGSGTSALFAALQVLRTRSDRREVLLPAYTAPSLVLPIRKAGLRPVLCDISVDTLNAGPDELLGRVGPGILAVMPVHMFGLPVDVAELLLRLEGTGTFTLEDACSALGTRFRDRHVGTFGDIGFYSFNRGKNLSTLAGGAIVTAREDLIPGLEAALAAFPAPAISRRLRSMAYSAGLALAVHPMGYTLLYPVVSQFKYTELHTDFEALCYPPFQAGLGRALLRKLASIAERRLSNARALCEALSGLEGVRLPHVPEGSLPAYNQFPILLRDERTRDAAHAAVLETGLEATRLYPEPIHRIYPDLWSGGGPDPFPNATAVSRRLLLLPVHPLVPDRALERATEAVRRALA